MLSFYCATVRTRACLSTLHVFVRALSNRFYLSVYRCVPGYVDQWTARNDRMSQEMIDIRPHTCIDLDECSRKVDDCMNDTLIGGCKNTIGSFLCQCATGYVGDALYASGDLACVNRNECAETKASSITGLSSNPPPKCQHTDDIPRPACTLARAFASPLEPATGYVPL